MIQSFGLSELKKLVETNRAPTVRSELSYEIVSLVLILSGQILSGPATQIPRSLLLSVVKKQWHNEVN